MTSEDRTKEQPVRELAEAQQQIAELKAALNAQQQVEEKQQAAYDYLITILLNLPIGVAILEGPKFRYFKINRILADINGLTIEEHLGRPLAEVLPDAKDAIIPGLQQVLETGEPTPQREFSTHLPKDPDETRHFIDTFFPVIDATGQAVAVGVAVIDITQLRQVQDALRESERRSREELEHLVEARTVELQKEIIEREQAEATLVEERNWLRVVIDNLPQKIYVKDVELRHVLINNNVRQGWAQITTQDVIGKTDFDLMTKEDAQFFYDQEQRILQTQEPLVDHEDFYKPDDDTEGIYYLISKFPIHDAEGNVTGLLGINYDVTELKLTQTALQSALEKEQELGAFRDRFMSMVSHEFRTPLSVIMASSHILERFDDKLTLERRGEHLRRIVRQITYLSEMLDNIMLAIQSENNPIQFKPNKTDLKALCDVLIEGMQDSIGADHEIIATYEDNLGDILADGKLLRIILTNLLSNAIKYSPKGSVIQLDVSQQSDECIIRLSDEGIGVSAEDKAQLFDPYHRAENVGNIKGVGLGLKIVKDFVELHSGRIEVESTLGKGTTFTVLLPASELEA